LAAGGAGGIGARRGVFVETPSRYHKIPRNHRRQGVSAGWERLGPGGVGDGLVFEVAATLPIAKLAHMGRETRERFPTARGKLFTAADMNRSAAVTF